MIDVVNEVLPNPYHKTEVKPHHLDVAEARLACFHAFNIATASQALGGRYQDADPNEHLEPTALFRLHHDFAEPSLSQLLLQIAVFVRTFDDVMRDLGGEAYAAHVAVTPGKDCVCDLDGAPLTLREACNKIIHACDFRPIYDHADHETEDDVFRRVWFMTGQIEIGGMQSMIQWDVLLDVEAFLEAVLDRIAFQPLPEPQ